MKGFLDTSDHHEISTRFAISILAYETIIHDRKISQLLAFFLHDLTWSRLEFSSCFENIKETARLIPIVSLLLSLDGTFKFTGN